MTPEQARLATALRELRARTGLSLAALAAKTAFSKSSWERYLNGKTLPPLPAVQELCRLAGEPDGRCLALWEIAESEWSGRATGAVPADTPSQAPSPVAAPAPPEVERAAPVEVAGGGHRGAAAVAVLASVCAVAVGGVALALLLLPRENGEPRPTAATSAPGPHCRGSSCEGRSPMDMYCAGSPATLADRRTATGAWVEVRYSKECGTSWARMWDTRVGDRLELTAGGRARGAEVANDVDADNFVYTPMTVTRLGTVLRTCFRPAADSKAECFRSVSR
jgi:transcriptional regulator with XRE-family HTH domain